MALFSGLKVAGWGCDSHGRRSLLCTQGTEEVGCVQRTRQLLPPAVTPRQSLSALKNQEMMYLM
jgi:hypothetical protein